MRRFLTALLAGALFGSGLLLSGMTNPANVIAFLDVTGAWSPALAVTMGGAVAVAAPAFLYVRRHGRTLDAESITLPDRRRIDRRLLVGAALFGVGWGLVGLCPGPALTGLVGGSPQVLLFVLAMLAGMVLHHLLLERKAS